MPQALRADYLGLTADLTARLYSPPRSTVNAYAGLPVPATTEPDSLTDLHRSGGGPMTKGDVSIIPHKALAGTVGRALQEDWFEKVHLLPAALDLGNILTVQQRTVEIFNAYRDEIRTVSTFTNNADAGVSILDLPALPHNIAILDGLVFTVEILPDGPPLLDGSLDFDLDTEAVSLGVVGVRVVMFPFIPQRPIRETLEWVTEIIAALDGTEQRISKRKNPRQIIELSVRLPREDLARKMNALLFDWQPRAFGIPIWWEARHATAPASAGAQLVNVDTAYGDFRVGSLAVLFRDEDTFDALEVTAVNAGSLEFGSPTQHDHDADTLVMPLRVALGSPSVDVAKYRVGAQDLRATFTTTNNDVALASLAAFSSYDGRLLMDDFNYIAGTLADDLERRVVEIDNKTASKIQDSPWSRSQYLTEKRWEADTPADLWNIRRALHALRGSQVAFYLPTHAEDLRPVATLVQGSSTLDIAHVGFAQFVEQRTPNRDIRVLFNDGTALVRRVQLSEEVDPTTERLTLDATWPETKQPADVRRIEFVRLSRIEGDRATLEHRAVGDATVAVRVRSLFN